MINRSFPPTRSEVVALLAELRALGVDPPADSERAVWLAGEVERLAAPPDMSGWVADADLRNLSAEDVMTALRRSVVQLRLADPAGRGLLRETVDALTARATAALAADVDRVLGELRPRWDVAAGVVASAAATGIRTASTTTSVIASGDDAVAAWRRVGPAVATLDRLHRVRIRLLRLADRKLADDDLGEQRWLDRSVAGPLQLANHPEEVHA